MMNEVDDDHHISTNKKETLHDNYRILDVNMCSMGILTPSGQSNQTQGTLG
ncbi:hypothetical protein YC2023_078067 [Brassica napus]